MEYKTDIEIAQACKLRPIGEIAARAHVDEKYLEQYGRYKAKVDPALLRESNRENGKLVLVTAITPTPAGEGKTTTTIGLADGLKRIGKDVTVALREPSLGPVFGIRWFPWKISTFILPVTSMPSGQLTICWPQCSTTTSSRETACISTRAVLPGSVVWT